MSLPAVEAEAGPNTRIEIDLLRQEVLALRSILQSVVKNGKVVVDHDDLGNLAFADSGHTGFASQANLTAHTGNTSNPHSVTIQQALSSSRDTSLPAAPSAPSLFWLNRQATPKGDIIYASIQLSTGSWDWLEIARRETE